MTVTKSAEAIVSLDGLNPQKIATKAADVGVTKATLDTSKMIILGLLAGIYISFGGLLATVAGAGASGMMSLGATQVLMGLVFSLGLILVVVGGAELFTGNVLLVIAVAEKRLSVAQLGRAWAIVYGANLVGALSMAVLVAVAGLHTAGDGAVAAKAIQIASFKTQLSLGTSLASGIIANALVCLAVWMSIGARSTTDKVIAIVPPVTAFVAVGSEHSIANMYLIPYGILIDGMTAGVTTSGPVQATLGLAEFIANLVAVTVGNIIGGALIGMAYWAAYLRR